MCLASRMKGLYGFVIESIGTDMIKEVMSFLGRFDSGRKERALKPILRAEDGFRLAWMMSLRGVE